MLPLRRVTVRPEHDPGSWYWQIPAVRQLRDKGLTLESGVTVLVGENGSGKSTLVEALAAAWRGRLDRGRGDALGLGRRRTTRAAGYADLFRQLTLDTERPPPQGGCFLRAESMHAVFDAVDTDAFELRAFDGTGLHTRSHGEGFLAFLESRRTERGLYLLDEPEAALSFRSCLALLVLLADAVAAGSQVVMATHSPLLAAAPGAQVLELGPDGIAVRDWAELDLVRDWQDFLAAPQRWLRHLEAPYEGWRRLRGIGLRRWLTLERDTLRQIAKTALAATLSWELAIRLLHSPLPALAALGAILTVQVTVKQTVTFGIQQVVGVTVGVGGAFAVVGLLGVHAWSVGIVILIALVIGHLLRLGKQVNQVAISALLVLALGTGYGSVRIVDTLLGAVVGVLVNATLAPPTHVQAAAAEIARVAEDLGLLLADVGKGLRTGWDHRAAQDWLRRARDLDAARARAGEAVRRGDESLLYNPLARGEAEAVARLTEAHTALEHVATQVRGVTRALADLATAPGLDAGSAAVPGRWPTRWSRPAPRWPRSAGSRSGATGPSCSGPTTPRWRGWPRCRGRWSELPSEQDPRTLVSLYVDAGRLLHEIDPADGAHTGAV